MQTPKQIAASYFMHRYYHAKALDIIAKIELVEALLKARRLTKIDIPLEP